MFRSLLSLKGYKLSEKDGELGKVDEFYFDDKKWTIRYLVADTGSWLPGKRVLIAPAAFHGQPDWDSKTFPLILTKDMVKEWTEDFEHKPISRQKEQEMATHHGWPLYWEVKELNALTSSEIPEQDNLALDERDEDSRLRSSKEVEGYHIHAKDGEIGHVHDFIVDDEDWSIRYIVVDTKNWLPGRKVLVSPNWIEKIKWSESKVYVELLQEKIKSSPEYNEFELLKREFEEQLYDHYGHKKYWDIAL